MESKSNKQKPGRPKNETESKIRVNIVLYPMDYSNLKKIAYVDRVSVSEILTKYIQEYVKKNKKKLEEYENIKPKE